METKRKQAAILMSDKTHFKPKVVTRNKRSLYNDKRDNTSRRYNNQIYMHPTSER